MNPELNFGFSISGMQESSPTTPGYGGTVSLFNAS